MYMVVCSGSFLSYKGCFFFLVSFFFFFNDTATTEIYTLSLHDALRSRHRLLRTTDGQRSRSLCAASRAEESRLLAARSEEHTSELLSRPHLVCRLLLEKKKNNIKKSLLSIKKKKK